MSHKYLLKGDPHECAPFLNEDECELCGSQLLQVTSMLVHEVLTVDVSIYSPNHVFGHVDTLIKDCLEFDLRP